MSCPFFDCLSPVRWVRVAGACALTLLLGSGAWAQDAATLTQITFDLAQLLDGVGTAAPQLSCHCAWKWRSASWTPACA